MVGCQKADTAAEKAAAEAKSKLAAEASILDASWKIPRVEETG